MNFIYVMKNFEISLCGKYVSFLLIHKVLCWEIIKLVYVEMNRNEKWICKKYVVLQNIPRDYSKDDGGTL